MEGGKGNGEGDVYIGIQIVNILEIFHICDIVKAFSSYASK